MESFGYKATSVLYTNPHAGVEVTVATELATGREVVLKRIPTRELPKVNNLLHEAMTQRCLDHPNICKVLRVGMYEEGVFIVLEKLQSDLAKFVQNQKNLQRKFPEEQVWNILAQLVEALAFAQEKGVSHRDVKPQNILVDSDGTLKLCDFGNAKEVDEHQSDHTFTGTPLYLSPQLREEFMHKIRSHEERKVHYNPHKSDVFSLGLTMVFVCTQVAPTRLAYIEDLQRLIVDALRELEYSDKLKQYLYWMLMIEEQQRPDFLALRESLKRMNEQAESGESNRESQMSAAAVVPQPSVRPQQVDHFRPADPQINMQPESPKPGPAYIAESKPKSQAAAEPKTCVDCALVIKMAFYKAPCGHYCCSLECLSHHKAGRQCRPS